MDQERINTYQSEISNWISKQGFFFQILQAPKLVGSSSGLITYFANIFIKLVVLALVVGLIYLYIIATAHHKPVYAENIGERIKTSLKAEEIHVEPLIGGLFSNVEVPEIIATGTKESFFDDLELQNVNMNLGNLISRRNNFNSSSISCSKLNFHAKISPGKEELLDKIYAPLFDESSWFNFKSFTARTFTCKWGYSKKTKGSIEGAKMTMDRKAGAWIVKITNGTINYGWIQGAEIKSIRILIKPDHFEITEALLEKNGAEFSLNMKVDKFAVNPLVSGSGEIHNCATKDLLHEDYIPYINGTVNTSFTFSGSPNSPKGLNYSFKPLISTVTENGVTNTIRRANDFKLTHNIPIWRALSTLDSSINYRGFVFNVTDWVVDLSGDEIYIKNADLSQKHDPSVHLALNLAIKEPTDSYIEKSLNVPESDLLDMLQRPGLKQKARELLRLKGNINNLSESKLEREDYAKLLRSERHFDGQATIKLHSESFKNRERVQEAIPVGRDQMRELTVPLEGPTGQVTEQQAQQLYQLGRKT